MRPPVTSLALLAAGIALSGCMSERVTRLELEQEMSSHPGETVGSLIYCGTENGMHYLRRDTILGLSQYKISDRELFLVNPFPYTWHSSRWRTIKHHRELWAEQELHRIMQSGSVKAYPVQQSGSYR